MYGPMPSEVTNAVRSLLTSYSSNLVAKVYPFGSFQEHLFDREIPRLSVREDVIRDSGCRVAARTYCPKHLEERSYQIVRLLTR